MIVADSGVLVEALMAPGASADRIDGEDVCAPHLVDVEVTSALRSALLGRRLTPKVAGEALDDFAQMDVLRYDHGPLLGRVWELRGNVTPYDAVYVALAERLDVPLVTTDARLAGAPGVKATVEVLPIG